MKPTDSKHDLDIKPELKNEILKGLNWYFPKDAHQKSEGGSEFRFKKTRLLHLENVENFFRNGRMRVNDQIVVIGIIFIKFLKEREEIRRMGKYGRSTRKRVQFEIYLVSI